MNLLEKTLLLENQAADFGFQWETPAQIMNQIQSECLEINEHLEKGITPANRAALQEEIGDLLHAVFSLCVFCNFSPEMTLSQTLSKFERRLEAVKDIAQEKGLVTLRGFGFDELMEVWREAKLRLEGPKLEK